MKVLSRMLIAIGSLLLLYFAYSIMDQRASQSESLAQAQERIQQGQVNQSTSIKKTTEQIEQKDPLYFKEELGEAFGTIEIPKLSRTLPIIEGAHDEALKNGVGHLTSTLLPGQGDQIIFSGHRDTVFTQFQKLEIGDQFIVTMPYGTYTYEIREFEIVPADDTTVIGEMGEEVLVVTTCYPFTYVGSAPDRHVTYAYPVDDSAM